VNLRALRQVYVARIYADHNSSMAVRRNLETLLSGISPGQTG